MKSILILLFPVLLFGQGFDNNKGFGGFGFGGQGFNTSVTSGSLIACGTVANNPPYSVYTNFALRMQPQQYFMELHDSLWDLKSTMTSWLIVFEIRFHSFANDPTIYAQFSATSNNIILRYNTSTGIITAILKDTTYNGVTIGTDLNWWSILFYFDGDSLKCYADRIPTPHNYAGDLPDTLRNSYPTTMPTVTPTYNSASSWGSAHELEAGGLNQIFTGGKLDCDIDNIYKKVGDSVTANINFNQGAGQYVHDSAGSIVWSRTFGPHDFRNKGAVLGNSVTTQDFFDPTYEYISGTRLDTLKYYSLGNGLRAHSSTTGYAYTSTNKLRPRPSDSTLVAAGGSFTSGTDSANGIPYLGFWNGTAWIEHGKTNQYLFDLVWKNDSILFLCGAIDSCLDVGASTWTATRRIAQLNYNSGVFTALDTGIAAALSGMALVGDTLYTFPYGVLFVYAWGGTTWKTYNIASPIVAMGNHSGQLWIWTYAGIYKKVGDTFTLVFTCDATNTQYIGQKVMQMDSEGRFWLCGDQDTVGGVYVNGIAYEQNGTLHPVGNTVTDPLIKNFTNACSGSPSCYNLIDAVTMTEWQGAIILAGSFLPNNIIMYANNRLCVLDYGIETSVWGSCAFKTTDGFYDLMVSGDFTSAGGIRANSVVARYSEAHFAALDPILTITDIADVTVAEYPPTATLLAYSPAWRALTMTCTYNISGGVTKTLTLSKTSDSTISNGVWQFNWSGAFGASDTVAIGDTVIYSITATDNLGNSATDSDTFAVITVPLVTDSLKLYWDYSDLSNGAVTTWLNRQDTVQLYQSTVGSKPTKTDSGVVYDGGDELHNATTSPGIFYGQGLAYEFVLKIVDTTNNQCLWWHMSGSPVFGSILHLWAQASKTSNKFNMINYKNGTHDATASVTWGSGTGITYINKFVQYVIMYDTTLTPRYRVYMNGVNQTLAGNFSSYNGTVRIATGDAIAFSRFMANGTVERVRLLYHVEGWSIAQKDAYALQNYNHWVDVGYIVP